MKKLLLLGVLFCATLPLLAQKVFFIYIQSDTRTPFYVRMGDKVMSSTASGYLILPKLKDSTYTFQLGPSTNEPELRFEVPVPAKDRGFLLKKFTEGWSLFDLQTMDKINPSATSGAATGSRLREDRFTTLLVRAADDTSLLYQPVLAAVAPAKKKSSTKEKTPERKEAITAPDVIVAAGNDSSTSALVQEGGSVVDTVLVAVSEPVSKEPADAPEKEETSTVAVVPDSGAETAESTYRKSLVTRQSGQATGEGFGLVYHDDVDGVVDTIQLVIPNGKLVFADEEPVGDETDTKAKTTVVSKAAPVAASCAAQASEKDYFKLRRNLASVDSENDMTREAVAAFRKRCFSAEQVKNLSSLFLTQAGKYNFLEAAYPYISDRTNFSALQSELFDPTYLARFKALTSN